MSVNNFSAFVGLTRRSPELILDDHDLRPMVGRQHFRGYVELGVRRIVGDIFMDRKRNLADNRGPCHGTKDRQKLPIDVQVGETAQEHRFY